jgi:lysophospholipase L1-like esterase
VKIKNLALAFLLGLLFSSAVTQSQQINPVSQVNWPATTGSGAPTQFCPSAATGSTVSGSPVVALSSATGIFPGQAVTGSGIPASTTVLSLFGLNATLSANATATASGVSLSFSSYGMPYTDITGNVSYVCASSGWVNNTPPANPVTGQVVNTIPLNTNGTSTAINAASALSQTGSGAGSTVTAAGNVAAPTTLPWPYAQVTSWGDSLTQGGEGTADQGYYPLILSNLSGFTVSNQGIYGQTSSDLYARMGAGPTPVTTESTLAGTAGATVEFTVPGGILGYRACYNSELTSLTINGSINGIAGSCVDSGDHTNYIFTRTASGSTLSAGSYNWLGNPGTLTAGLNIIWIGTNNLTRPPTVLSDIAGIVASLPVGSRYVILSPLQVNYQVGWGPNGESMDRARAVIQSLQGTYGPVSASCPTGNCFLEVRERLVSQFNQSSPLDVQDNINDQTPSSIRAYFGPGSAGFGNLSANITTTTTCSFSVTGSSAIAQGYSLLIDSENIYVSAASGETATGCIRGYAGSTAATHTAGVSVTGWDLVHLQVAGYTDIANWVYQWMLQNAGLGTSYLAPTNTVIASANAATQPAWLGNRYVYSTGNTFGDQINFYEGMDAGINNYVGQFNWASGVSAYASATSGNGNTVCGYHSLNQEIDGGSNFSCGYEASAHNLHGVDTVAFAANAAINATGNYYFAGGTNAGASNISGNGWFAEAYAALYNNTGCSTCHASGYEAAFSNISGDAFTALGNQAAYNNAIGSYFTSAGPFAGYSNVAASYWTAFGPYADYSNITGYSFFGAGYNAGDKRDFGGSGTSTFSPGTNSISMALSSGSAPLVGEMLTGTGIASGTLITAVSGSGPYALTLSSNTTASSGGTYIWSAVAGGNGTTSFSSGTNPITVTVSSGGNPQINSEFVGANVPALDLITSVSCSGTCSVTLATAPTGTSSGTYTWDTPNGVADTDVGTNAGSIGSVGNYDTNVGNNAGIFLNTSNNVTLGASAGAFSADGVTHNVNTYQSTYIGAFTKASADGVLSEIAIGYECAGKGSSIFTFCVPGILGVQNNTAGNLTLDGSASAGGGITFNGDGASPSSMTVGVNAAGTTMTLGSNANVTSAGALTVTSCSGCGSSVTAAAEVIPLATFNSTAGTAIPNGSTAMYSYNFPTAINLGHLGVRITTADNTGTNLYDIGVYSLGFGTGTSGSLLAHTGPIAGTTFAPATGFVSEAMTSSVLLAPGTYLIAVTSNCASSCAALAASANTIGISRFGSTGSGTGGTLPSTITPASFSPNFSSNIWGMAAFQ